MTRRDREAGVFFGLLLTLFSVLGCSSLWANGSEGWKVPVGDAAEVLREAADTIERFDTSGDGELDEFEWTAAALVLATELQGRADASGSGR